MKYAVTLFVVAIACAIFAANVEVFDEDSVSLVTGDVICAAPTGVTPDELPAVDVTPIFRFDCSRTDGWVFADGTNAVEKIPSLDGSRFLYGADGVLKDVCTGTWNTSDEWTVLRPVLAQDEELGASVLDFGAHGSCRALLFDGEEDGANRLAGVGTVVAVWNSAGGGGTVLGGGYGPHASGTENPGLMWVRGSPLVSVPDIYYGNWYPLNPDFRSPLFDSGTMVSGGLAYRPLPAAANGCARLDGVEVRPTGTGFSGGWQIVSVVPTNTAGVANGIGLGIVRQNVSALSGGMKIAEMIVYGERLDVLRLSRVEAYLAKKWFGRVRTGFDGNVRIGELSVSTAGTRLGATNVFSVAAGETIEARRTASGRGIGARIVKNGEGTVVFGSLRDYAGTLELAGGTARMAPKPTPSTFPVKPMFHLDPSDASSMTLEYDAEHGVSNVVRIASGSDFVFRGKTLCARRSTSAPAPFLRPAMFADVNGKPAPALDFHDLVGKGQGLTWGVTGGVLYIADAEKEDAPTVTLPNVATLIAVVAPRDKGGHIVGNGGTADPAAAASSGCYFDRNQNGDQGSITRPILGTKPVTRLHPTLTPTNGLLMIDGKVMDPLACYVRRDFQIVAIRVPASFVSMIGSTWSAYWAGGFMLAEMALWDQALTEEQLRDATAYLSAKWFRRILPGYASTARESGVADVAAIDVTAASTLEIAEGTALHVGKLTASAPLRLAGGGTLKLTAGAPCGPEGPAAAPSADFDASLTNTFIMASFGIYTWADRNRSLVGTRTSQYPELKMNATPTGLPAVGFGSFRSNKGLKFERSLDSVRSAFVVAAANTAGNGFGGVMLGSARLGGEDNVGYYDVPYSNNSTGYPAGPYRAGAATAMSSAPGVSYLTNGVSVSSNVRYPDDGSYRLYEIHFPAGTHVSGLCVRGYMNNGSYDEYLYSGGFDIAEAVLYERELSDREKAATRNHLMKKWLGLDGAPLPDEPAAQSCSLVALTGAGTLEAASVSLAGLSADCAGADVPTVTGEAVLGEGVVVTVANADRLDGREVFVPVLRCASCTGIPAVSELEFSGDLSWRKLYRARLVYRDGAVGVLFEYSKGLQLIVR